ASKRARLPDRPLGDRGRHAWAERAESHGHEWKIVAAYGAPHLSSGRGSSLAGHQRRRRRSSDAPAWFLFQGGQPGRRAVGSDVSRDQFAPPREHGTAGARQDLFTDGGANA